MNGRKILLQVSLWGAGALFLVGIFFSGGERLSADVSMQALEVDEEKQIWLSGLKHRVDIAIPGVGHQTSVITRADRGIEWIIDHQRRQYEEHSLAPVYEPGNGMDAAEGAETEEGRVAQPESSTCKAEVVSTKETRVIAGHKALGYRVGCSGEPETVMTLWMAESAPPLTDAVSQARVFYQAYARLQGPPIPQEVPDAWLVSEFFAEELVDLVGDMRLLPPGIPLEAEGSGELSHAGQAERATIVRVKSIAFDAIDSQIFEIPQGYTQVDSLVDIDAS